MVNAVQFLVLQLPLSLTALGLYIRDTQCGPFARRSQSLPPQPFCTAPIVLAAVIVLVEVCKVKTRSHYAICHILTCCVNIHDAMLCSVLCRQMPPCLSWRGPVCCAASPETCCKTAMISLKYGLSREWWYVVPQVVIFLMVLFITQTFRHERIMELARQVADADLERARQDAVSAQKYFGVMLHSLPVAFAAMQSHPVSEDAVTCLRRRALVVEDYGDRMVRPEARAAIQSAEALGSVAIRSVSEVSSIFNIQHTLGNHSCS